MGSFHVFTIFVAESVNQHGIVQIVHSFPLGDISRFYDPPEWSKLSSVAISISINFDRK